MRRDSATRLPRSPRRQGAAASASSASPVRSLRTIAREILGELPEPRRAALRVVSRRRRRAARQRPRAVFPGAGILHRRRRARAARPRRSRRHGHAARTRVELGARLAEPGEFSRRAFLNDKLDLDAGRSDRRSDRQRLGRSGARRPALVARRVLRRRAFADRSGDRNAHACRGRDRFSGRGNRLPRRHGAARRASTARIELCAQIAAKARQGALLREGMTVVIAGRPNAGKSSLLNRLAGYDAAIVTDDSRHDARRAARAHPHRRHAAAHRGYGRPARRGGCRRSRRHSSRARRR